MRQPLELFIEPFDALNLLQLYQIMQLRQRVFILEQQSLYDDLDNQDQAATHIMYYDGAKLAAYARIIPPHLSDDQVSIGRVVVHGQYRGQGWGAAVFETALEQAQRQYPNLAVKLSAQVDAQALYHRFGFRAVGEVYDDGGIPHVKMVLAPASA